MKHLITTILVLMAPLASANVGDELTAPETKSGVYWVPVGQQLSQFALFSIPEVEMNVEDGRVRLEYELPHELTGAPNVIELEGPNVESGTMVLTGAYGRMECSAPNDFSNCAVTYRDLNFDASARTALLQSISKSDEELRKRELVAARFQLGGEPHGFLRILSQKTPRY